MDESPAQNGEAGPVEKLQTLIDTTLARRGGGDGPSPAALHFERMVDLIFAADDEQVYERAVRALKPAAKDALGRL